MAAKDKEKKAKEEELAALAAAREEERRAQLKRCDLLSVDDRLVRTL